ncbi:hypothetical protein VT03_27865 [Planctomyces sp. SH-PL14]|nr:hypothetical protein VT03_27865 [Planctomyces sp. SH-PL14]
MPLTFPRHEQFGCLFSLLGILCGCTASSVSAARWAARMRAENPDAPICGNPFIGALFLGLFVGGIGGWTVGLVVHHATSPRPPREGG